GRSRWRTDTGLRWRAREALPRYVRGRAARGLAGRRRPWCRCRAPRRSRRRSTDYGRNASTSAAALRGYGWGRIALRHRTWVDDRRNGGHLARACGQRRLERIPGVHRVPGVSRRRYERGTRFAPPGAEQQSALEPGDREVEHDEL